MHAKHWSLAFLICRWYQPVQTRIHQSWTFFLGLVDSNRNRLVSAAYQKKPGYSVVNASENILSDWNRNFTNCLKFSDNLQIAWFDKLSLTYTYCEVWLLRLLCLKSISYGDRGLRLIRIFSIWGSIWLLRHFCLLAQERNTIIMENNTMDIYI